MKRKKLFSSIISAFTAVSLAFSPVSMPVFAAEAAETVTETEESEPSVYTVVFYNQDEEPVVREFEEGYILTDEDFPTVAVRDDEEFEGWFDYDTNEEIKAGTVIDSDLTYVVACITEKSGEASASYKVTFYDGEKSPVVKEFEAGYVLTDEDIPAADETVENDVFHAWIDFNTDEEVTAGIAVSSDMYVIADRDHYLTVALFDNVNGSDPLFYDVLSGTSVMDILPESEDGTHYTDSEGNLITGDSVIGNSDMTIYLNACDYHTHVGNKDGAGVATRTCRICGYTYTENTDITEGLAVYRGSDFYQQNAVISDEGDQTVQYPVSDEEYEVLAGDWDGDGIDEIGIRIGNVYYFYYADGCEKADVVVRFGKSTDEAVTGDWDGDGRDTLAVRRDGNHYYFQTVIDSDEVFAEVRFGQYYDEVLTGDWDGDGRDTLAVCRRAAAAVGANHYYFQSEITADDVFTDVFYGKKSDEVLAGDWNGDGWDTLAVCRDGNYYLFQEYLTDEQSYLATRYGHASDKVVAGRWR